MAKLLYYLASASYFTANSHQPQLHTQTTSFFPSPLAVRPLHSFFSFSAIHHLPFLYLHACMSLICFSCVQLFATLWSVAHQAPLSMGFSRQEYQSELPFSSPADLPNPRIEPKSLMPPEFAGRFFTTSTSWDTILPALHRLILQITHIIATITILIYT